jgi:hypothetical protein
MTTKIPRTPALLLEGSFILVGGALYVCPNPNSGRPVAPDLEGFLGREVFLQAHHLPRSPPGVGAPGFGSCLDPASCHRHQDDPGWAFHVLLEGVFGRSRSGNWEVKGRPASLGLLAGHQGRILIFSPEDPSGRESVSDLASQASGLVEVLSGLQNFLKKDSL